MNNKPMLRQYFTGWQWKFALLAALFLFLRLPIFFEPAWHADEGLFIFMGARLADGAQLYIDVWDHKPPMIFWIYNLLHILPGDPILLGRFVFASAVLITLSLVFFYTKYLVDLPTAYLAVGITTLFLASPKMSNSGPNVEELLMPLVILSLYFFSESIKHHRIRNIAIATSLLTIAAFYFKPTAGLYLPIFSLWVYWEIFKKTSLIYLIYVVGAALTAFAAVIIVWAAWFWWQGNLPEALDAVFFYNVTQYSVVAFEGFSERVMISGYYWLSLCLTGLVLLLNGVENIKRYPQLFLWLGANWLVLYTGGGRLFPQYFAPFYAPLGVLLALGILRILRHYYHTVMWRAFAVGFVLFAIFNLNSLALDYYGHWIRYVTGFETRAEYEATFGEKHQLAHETADYLRTQTSPTDYVYYWGWESATWAQYFAERPNPTRFLWNSHVVTVQNNVIPDTVQTPEVLTALQENPPEYIVVIFPDFPHSMHPLPNELQAFVEANYRLDPHFIHQEIVFWHYDS